MTAPEPANELLFSYGTLQLEAVQLATFGRLLEGVDDEIPGFAVSMVEIGDEEVVATSGQTHHPIVRFTGAPSDFVSGKAFAVTSAELSRADEYEVDAYQRIAVTLRSGSQAWVYVDARDLPRT